MNRTRTTAALAGLAAVAMLAAGCGGDSSSGGDGGYKLAFIQGVTGDAFYVTMGCGVQQKAKELGATVSIQGAQKFDPTLQTPVLQSVISSRPDAILIAPTDAKSMEQPIKQATAAGIKVVLVDTTLENTGDVVSSISSDNEGGGAAAFKAIQQLAPNGGKVLVIDNQPGISTSDARTKGFDDAAKADSKYTNLGVQYVQNDPAKAAQIVTAALQKDPDIVGIFATNLFGATGASTGVRQAGKQGAVKIVGFDAGSDQVKALQEGTIQALIAQQPGTIGTDGVDQAVKSLKGESTEKTIQTGFTIVTKDNLNSSEGQAALYKSSC
ncbi:ABC transporter substrate-binding protein [Cryptosporangium phraense]|uniref:Substrate-binding domain-containing protein n=1 Tax=Cryptosporangium phraense TaxID=2593070 RepID=A0A545AIH4_9ACTN|nr:ABC transporter substrate-binding protein [Cryptosporangium phraense]TQS41050.1 substrate-binding domain-containing protein [Cryptosporangium phraense]